MKRNDDYIRGQVSVLSFIEGWLAMMQRIEDERRGNPLAAPSLAPSRWSAIQEIKSLRDGIVAHIGPDD